MVRPMQLTLIREVGASPPVPGTEEGRTPVRPILERDLDAVGRLYAASYPSGEVGDEAEAIADVRASWDGAYGAWLQECCLLAEQDGAPVAAILVVDAPPWDDVSEMVFIIDLFTDPTHRGHGLGGRLVRSALASTEVGRIVGLRVESDNEAAVHLYRKLGFCARR